MARSIGENLTDYRIIVDKSTVPVGTADRVKAEIQAALDERGVPAEQAASEIATPELDLDGMGPVIRRLSPTSYPHPEVAPQLLQW